jgi:hypothetical protein
MESAKVILASGGINKGWKCHGGQVAHCNLIRSSVFDNLSAKIRASNSAEILLVALAVASIFIEHERVASLSLSFKDGVPKLLSFDGLSSTSLFLVPDVLG